MANQVSSLLNFIVDTLDKNPLVNTIIFKDSDVYDVEKENVYPLVSIQLLNAPAPTENLREFKLSFEVLNQRDDIKKANTSKLMLDTNYIDNIGICDSIANDFILEIIKSHNDLNITIVEGGVSEFETIRRDERNCLDGIYFELNLSTYQNGI
jgi:hypothetical protein